MGKKELLESLKSKGFPGFIIKSFEKVKREDFVLEIYREFAYDDNALPIGQEQTISQPFTIAFMLNLMKLDKIKNKKCRVLEVGSGSGYVLALLSAIFKKAEITGLEINKGLADNSQKLLSEVKNIRILNRQGIEGLPEGAPFDRILVSASADNLSQLNILIGQLSEKGILVAPVQHTIYKIEKSGREVLKKEFYGFSFVPLKR